MRSSRAATRWCASGGAGASVLEAPGLPPSSPNQNTDSAVRTRPLSGMGVERTWSKAEIRSDATSSSVSSSTS